jgi:hypothetical protein
MKFIIFLILFFAFNTGASSISKDILASDFLISQKLDSWIKKYGEPLKRKEDLYYFKTKNEDIFLTVVGRRILGVEINFRKQKYFASQYKEQLKAYKKGKFDGHEMGRYHLMTTVNEKLYFRNNIKFNLEKLVYRW